VRPIIIYQENILQGICHVWVLKDEAGLFIGRMA